MAQATHGVGGLKYDSAKRTRPQELNVFLALVAIVLIFELLNRINGSSFLFNVRDNVDTLFNQQRLDIIVLQVAITGIIAIGVTQVIILGGIDLSSGSVVGATAMIVMSFAQTAIVNGNPNPKALNKTCEQAAQRLRVLIDEANAIANGEALSDRTDPDTIGDVGGQAAIDALFGTR